MGSHAGGCDSRHLWAGFHRTDFDFGDGLQAHIFVSWLHPYKEQRLVVVGDEGMAVFDDVAPEANKLLFYPHKAHWDGEMPVVSKAEAEQIPFARDEPLRRELETFIDAVKTGTGPPSDASEGIDVLRVLAASQESLNTGLPQRIEGA